MTGVDSIRPLLLLGVLLGQHLFLLLLYFRINLCALGWFVTMVSGLVILRQYRFVATLLVW